MPFGFSDVFEIEPLDPDAEHKALFGIELAKPHKSAFEAACVVFPINTTKALWVSHNWINDPKVIEAKEIFLKSQSEIKQPPLDKDQLAAKLLHIIEEKNASGTAYIVEDKERIAGLKLYAEIQGFIGKQASVTNFNNNISNKSIVVKFVDPDKPKEQPKVIEHEPQHLVPEVKSAIKVKLVS